jgi:hypothetical protein
MAATWKNIDKMESGNRVTQIHAIRVDTNSKDVEFFREVLILVGIPDQETVYGMSETELQTYVENHVDMSELDTGIATEDEPPIADFFENLEVSDEEDSEDSTDESSDDSNSGE